MGVAMYEMMSNVLRPNRSLREPEKKAPTTPAACRMDKEAPAVQRLEPSTVRNVGRNVDNVADTIEREMINTARGRMTRQNFPWSIFPSWCSFLISGWVVICFNLMKRNMEDS